MYNAHLLWKTLTVLKKTRPYLIPPPPRHNGIKILEIPNSQAELLNGLDNSITFSYL